MNMFPRADKNTRLFIDRHHAGLELAKRLAKYAAENPVILALPRGGVVIGYEIAKAFHSPLDVIIARKIGLPHNKEFGIGAIGEEGVRILDNRVIDIIGLPMDTVENIINEEMNELKRRIHLYRKNRPLPDLKNKTVILVDDGLATGVTAKAAIQAIKKLHPKKIIFASPICSYESAQDLRSFVNDIVCLATPLDLMAIGLWYQNFDQVTDEEVIDLLERAKEFKQPGERERHRKRQDVQSPNT
jgi:putative phosphoribosyl transferase